MTTTIEITKAAIKDPMTRRELVEAALRAELESRGIMLGPYIGTFIIDPEIPTDYESVNFRISEMEAYSGPNKGRLTVSIGDWGSKKSYAEPIKNGYDIPKLADRMLDLLKEIKEDKIRKKWIHDTEQASSRLADKIGDEFPDVDTQFLGCGAADMVKLRAQHLTLDQAREVAALLMKFKAEGN